ncbi:MAG: proton-conducting transporter membrane subunit, partial [Ornithinibacter sp.]
VVLVLVVDAVVPGRRTSWAPALGVVLLVAGAVLALRPSVADDGAALRSLCLPAPQEICLWNAGPSTGALQAAVLLSAAAALALFDRGDRAVTTTLVLAAATGGVGVAASRDVGTWLVTLELATVPIVALVALRGTRSSSHGALTLLVTSVVSFALLVLGVALWLTATGEAVFGTEAVARAWAVDERRAVLALAVTVLLAGLGFKLSLVPFHAWTPQAFSTADLGTATYLAVASKVAAAGALFVVVGAFVGVDAPQVALVLGVLAAVSMLLGNVMALRQDDVTRLLAWSTVAQAGWVVLPVAALSAAGIRASAAYVLTYALATVVAFAAVAGVGARTVEQHRGLVRRDPLSGAPLGFALLVLAGVPPAVLGLVAKVVALGPVVDSGLWVLVGVAVVAVVLGLAVYLRWFAVLLAHPSGEADELPAVPPRRRAVEVVVVTGTGLLVVLSVVPGLLLGLLG